MSKCDIRIEFDRGDRTYRGGETVSGTVYVRANKDVTCQALTLYLSWQTHGKGNKDGKEIQTSIEPERKWEADREYAYPFRFALPAAPLTYHGHYINLDYYVKARADIPWGLDPKAGEEVLVLPGIEAVPEEAPKEEGQVPDAWLGRKPKELRDFIPSTVPGALIALLVFAGIVYLFPIFGIILFLVLIVFNRPLRNLWVEKKLGRIVVDFKGGRVHPEDTLPIRLRFDRPGSVKINAAFAKIEGQEICESGSGTNVRTFKHDIYAEQIALGAASFNEFSGEIRVPATEAYSFQAPDNRILWSVTLCLEVPKWPDWQKTYPIEIVPRPVDTGKG